MANIQVNRSINAGTTQVTKTGTAPAYAEGTFTPTLVAYGGSPTIQPEFSSEVSFGRYQRIGNKVIVDVDFYGDNCNVKGTGFLAIGNLPFVADASTITIGIATPGSGQTAPTGCQFDSSQGTLLKLSDMTLGYFGYTGADYFNTSDNFNVQAHIEYWID
jgi:hypothetical protein